MTQGHPGEAGKPGRADGTGGAGGLGGAGGAGVRGLEGLTGERGRPGKTGPAGNTLQALKFTDRRILYGFLLVIASFMLVSARTEINASHIASQQHRQDVHNWKVCQSSARFAEQLDGFLHGMSALEATNHSITTDLRQARIRLYGGLVLIPPDCGPRP